MESEVVVANSEIYEKISILVVDDDTTCLLITSALLKKEKYKVVTAKNAKDALRILGISCNSFDLVITEVHMPEMDGFQLQQQIAKEFDVPVIFMSADEKENTAMKGLENGGVLFILKPISQDYIRNLWQYATMRRKKKNIGKPVIEIQENTNEKSPLEVIYAESSSSINEKTNKDMSIAPKRSRIVWTDFLHSKFLQAVATTGLENAHPKSILAAMDTPGLTRVNVASHLQKYRNYLEKVTTPANTSSKMVSGSVNTIFSNGRNIVSTPANTSSELVSSLSNTIFGNARKLITTPTNTSSELVSNWRNTTFGNAKKVVLTPANTSSELVSRSNITTFGNAKYLSTRKAADNIPIHQLLNDTTNSAKQLMTRNVHSVADDTVADHQGNDHLVANKQGTYDGITTEDISVQLLNPPWNFELEQENYESVSTEDITFQLLNSPLNLELEQRNYGGINAKERSDHLHI